MSSNDKELLILIPAKAASVRLPQKNMQLLGGKPLLQWTIDSALNSGIKARIVVSSESKAITEFAEETEGVVGHLRPERLAVDPAGVVDVALFVLAELQKRGERFSTLIILLPTCPFRAPTDIAKAYQMFLSKQAKFLMSVSSFPHTPLAALQLDEADKLSPYFPEYIGRKSQDMPSAFRANGAIHILDVEAFQQERSYYATPLFGYVMPWFRSIDIDTAIDLDYADYLLKKEDIWSKLS